MCSKTRSPSRLYNISHSLGSPKTESSKSTPPGEPAGPKKAMTRHPSSPLLKSATLSRLTLTLPAGPSSPIALNPSLDPQIHLRRSLATDTVIGCDAHRTPSISSRLATPDWLSVMSTVTVSMISIFVRKTAFPTGSIYKSPTEPSATNLTRLRSTGSRVHAAPF